MYAIFSIGIGYVLGCISPAAFVSKRKQVDLTQEGTGNLGATNTALVLGKAAGIFVMLFDIFKSWFAFRIARQMFRQKMLAGILASIGAILGHCFPVNMKFQGGKGLAAFGGLILAYKPIFFPMIVLPAIVLMVIFDTGVVAPMFATVAFPILVYQHSGDLIQLLAVIAACGIIVLMHKENLKLALHRKDVVNTRQFFEKVFMKKEK